MSNTSAEPTEDEGLSDGALGRAMAFGFTAGTVGMTLITFVICLVIGDAPVGTAAAISIVPGIVAGFFFGGLAWLSAEVTRSEHADHAKG
jgi:hypothetical protein